MKIEPLSSDKRAQLLRQNLERIITYDESLTAYNLTPTQHLVSVRKRIEELSALGSTAKIVKDTLLFDENRKTRKGVDRDNQYCRLFNTTPQRIKEVYELRKQGKCFPAGFLISFYNCEETLKLMIDERMPGFMSANRNAQVEMINNFINEKGRTKKEFFFGNEVKSILENGPIGRRSFGEVIRHLDKVFQNENNQPSWFDLSEQTHSHQWRLSQKNQWKDETKSYEALKHLIEENVPEIKTAQRNDQITILEEKVFKYTPSHTADVRFKGAHQWFVDHEIGGLLVSKRYKGTVSDVLRDFDAKYSVERNQHPWFDMSQDVVLPWWKYCKDWIRKKDQSYDVLKFILEKIEGFKGASRSEQLRLIREKVCNYYSKEKSGAMGWFRDHGLEPFILSTYIKPSGIVDSLKWFDSLYSSERAQENWFNESKDQHLASKSNRFKKTQLVVVGYE